jgi:predicted DNA-binding transcriptional regulator AlpA
MRRIVRSPWDYVGYSRSHYYRKLETDPELPRLIKISEDGRAVGSDSEELERYIEKRVRAAKGEAA